MSAYSLHPLPIADAYRLHLGAEPCGLVYLEHEAQAWFVAVDHSSPGSRFDRLEDAPASLRVAAHSEFPKLFDLCSALGIDQGVASMPADYQSGFYSGAGY